MKQWLTNIFNAIVNNKEALSVNNKKELTHTQQLQLKRTKMIKSTSHSLYGSLGIAISLLLAYTNTTMAYTGASWLATLSNGNHYVDYVSYPITYGVAHLLGTGVSKFKPVGYTLAIPAIILTSPFIIMLNKQIKAHKNNEYINCHECLDFKKKALEINDKAVVNKSEQ